MSAGNGFNGNAARDILTQPIDGRGKHKQSLAVIEGNPDARPLAPGIELWDRQPRETDQAWDAFRRYRDLLQDRSLAKIAREVGKSTALMERWSRKWQWNRRAYEYEVYLDRAAQQEAHRERGKMAVRHAQQAQLHMSALAAPAMALLQRIQQDPQFMMRLMESCSLRDANGAIIGMDVEKTVKVLDTVRKFADSIAGVANVERLARGEPTSIAQGDVTTRAAEAAPPAKDDSAARMLFADPGVAAKANELFAMLQSAEQARA